MGRFDQEPASLSNHRFAWLKTARGIVAGSGKNHAGDRLQANHENLQTAVRKSTDPIDMEGISMN
jgi:hypothetical protein